MICIIRTHSYISISLYEIQTPITISARGRPRASDQCPHKGAKIRAEIPDAIGRDGVWKDVRDVKRN